jgi:hypothetical protein
MVVVTVTVCIARGPMGGCNMTKCCARKSANRPALSLWLALGHINTNVTIKQVRAPRTRG